MTINLKWLHLTGFSIKWLHSMHALCFLVFDFIKWERATKYLRVCCPKNTTYYKGYGKNRKNLLRFFFFFLIKGHFITLDQFILQKRFVLQWAVRDFSAAPTCYCNKTSSCLLFRATAGKPRPMNLWFKTAAGEATPMNLWSSPLTEFSERVCGFLRKSHSWVNLTPIAHHIG